MERKETLKDGTKVIMRYFSPKDLNNIIEFYINLLPDYDAYLRVNGKNQKAVDYRARTGEFGDIIRIIAVHGEGIVADGALELLLDEQDRHNAELRVIVAKKFRHKGLGTIMMRELCLLAEQNKVDRLVVKLTKPQVAAQTICKKLGFHEEPPTPGLTPNQNGGILDFIIMTTKVKYFWKELEHLYLDSAWRRSR
jgi:L-amino acid N-acyltransferase YncA